MKAEYTPPTFSSTAFNCTQCGAYAAQHWSFLATAGHGSVRLPLSIPRFRADLPHEYAASRCSRCKALTFWKDNGIIFPCAITVERPNDDLSDEIKELYKEAATILSDSPRAAAALLRLALQLLLKEVGGAGKNINDDIATIVAAGVDPQVQRAMDILRVFGNNAAHPGEINLHEQSELVTKMFELINFVANKMITQKKELDQMFDGLPEAVKQQIATRDKKEAING